MTVAIKCINLIQVICDDCAKTIMLPRWQDAPKLGWIAPIDGAFQRCKECGEKHAERLFAEAKLAEIAKKCPLVNKD